MNEATIEATNPPISHPERPTATTSPQVTAPRNNQTAKSGTSQAGRRSRSGRHQSETRGNG